MLILEFLKFLFKYLGNLKYKKIIFNLYLNGCNLLFIKYVKYKLRMTFLWHGIIIFYKMLNATCNTVKKNSLINQHMEDIYMK